MSQDGVPPGEPGSTPEAAAQTPPADAVSSPPVSPTTDPAAWPAPDQSTQVLDPDAQQTAAYPYQAQDPYQQQADAYAQTQQTTAYPNAAFDYSQQTEQPPAAPQWPTPGADGYLPPPPGVTPTTAPPAPKSGGVGKFIAIAALTGLLAGVGGGALGYSLAQDSGTSSSVTVNAPSNPEGLSPRADGSIATIAEKVLPSVVSLEVSGSGQAGSGSGFVVSQDGYILTNNHVIEAAADNGSIEVVLQDGTRVTGDLIGRNADYDLAVVKIDNPD
jgi:putative serine protease PepD